MIKGATVIMSDEYISELERHRANLEAQLKLEDIPDKQNIISGKIALLTKKIEEAVEFQDTVEEIVNLDIPSMAVVKTISGLVLPLPNVKVL